MNQPAEKLYLWRQFTLREALLLGFCATFVIVTRAGLRLHLHLPGHVMFFTMFFFLLARGCVPKIGSAALVGLITCIASVILGMGMGGPIVLAKYLLPALVVEAAGLIAPSYLNHMLACAAVGVIASATRVAASTGVEWLMGIEEEVLVSKALVSAAGNSLFGGLGALAVPSIVRILRKNGLIAAKSGRR